MLVESLQGDPGRDANANRFLKTVVHDEVVSLELARRAVELRRRAKRGSAVDALVVCLAEPTGTVLTGDKAVVSALAAVSEGVVLELG